MCIAAYAFFILPSIIQTAPFEPNSLCYLDYFKVDWSEVHRCDYGSPPNRIINIQLKDCNTKKMIPANTICRILNEKYVIVFNELFEDTNKTKKDICK
jgi:hypothetical protein